MAVSVFDLFKIGIGPSSSHTVGPMRAAQRFLAVSVEEEGHLDNVARVRSEVFGSLALTGRGHSTDKAILLGLSGEIPDQVNPDEVPKILEEITTSRTINLLGKKKIDFKLRGDLVMNRRKQLPYHTNGMRFEAFDADGDLLVSKVFYSIGGGFVVNEDEAAEDRIVSDRTAIPYRFKSGDEMMAMSAESSKSIAEMVFENELTWRSADEIRSGLDTLWEAMNSCIERGFTQEGVLPGILGVRRRAPGLYADLCTGPEGNPEAGSDPLTVLDWVNLYALSVNEENAAGGRVVTAPTNGAAGIIPAVLRYYLKFIPGADREGIHRFMLTAAAIGILYKENASISGAEVGCQGEVGVACSMAAGGLTAAVGGTTPQIENAAEIGMEHNLGLTCDPVGGLVQVPCIERNAMGSVKAINAMRMAMRGEGIHHVSLDEVIKTMRETGKDMMEKYKETSRGGLAVNVIEC